MRKPRRLTTHLREDARRGRLLLCSAAALTLAAGCSDDASRPIGDEPLAGEILGSPFVARSALANAIFDDGTKRISIRDTVETCLDSGIGDRGVLTSIEWVAGVAYDFGFEHTATIVTRQPDGSLFNCIDTSDGRIEVVTAPGPGQIGTIKLRVVCDDDHVEGRVDVMVCD